MPSSSSSSSEVSELTSRVNDLSAQIKELLTLKQSSRKCYKCGDRGHEASECNIETSNVQPREVIIHPNPSATPIVIPSAAPSVLRSESRIMIGPDNVPREVIYLDSGSSAQYFTSSAERSVSNSPLTRWSADQL